MKELIEQFETLLSEINEINQPLARLVLLDIARQRLKEIIVQLKNEQQ